jgi:hypothetical protein
MPSNDAIEKLAAGSQLLGQKAKARTKQGSPSDFGGPVIPNPDNLRAQWDTESSRDAAKVKPIPTRGWKVGPQKDLPPFDTINPGRSRIVIRDYSLREQ